MNEEEQIDSKTVKQELVRILDVLKKWRHEDEEKQKITEVKN